MSKQQDKEVERVMRIRDHQIAARNPHAKRDRLNKEVVRRRRNKVGQFSQGGMIGEMFTTMSHKVRGVIYGLVLGTIASVVLTLMVTDSWGPIVGLALFFLFPLIGVVLGASFDWRDSLRDEMKGR